MKTTNGVTTVSTTNADLPQVVRNVPDKASAFAMTTLATTFTPGDGVTMRPTRLGTSVQRQVHRTGLRATANGAVELKLNAELRIGSALLLATGTMSMTPVIDFELDADWGRIKHYKLGAGVVVDDDVKITVGFGGKRESPKILLGVLRHTAVAFIGPVPVWVEMISPIYVQGEASGQIGVVVGYTRAGRSTAGVQNQRGILKPVIYTTSSQTESGISDVRAEGTLSAFAGAEPTLLLYSTGGAYAKLGYRAELNLSFGSGALGCTLTHGPYAEFGLKSADWIEKLTGQRFKVNTEVSFPKARIEVCPDLGPTDVGSVSPFFANGDLRPDWSLDDQRDGQPDAICYTGSPVAPAGGVWECSPNGLLVCWPDQVSPTDSVVCGDDPWGRDVRVLDAKFEGVLEPPTQDIRPWGVELADGTRCVSRHGGSWSGRPNDDYVGGYSCITGNPDEFLVVLVRPGDLERVDRGRSAWTVKIGYLDGDTRAANPPVTALVKRAWFAAAAG